MIDRADQLLDLRRSDLDELFTNSPSGDVPVGRGRGTVLFATGTRLARVAARAAYAVAWKGKVFAPSGDTLKNLITPFGVPAIKAVVYPERSWFDDKDCTVLDYSKTSIVARYIRDEIREIAPGLFLGLVFWGRRRVLGFSLTFDA
jgi:hypothetical protein